MDKQGETTEMVSQQPRNQSVAQLPKFNHDCTKVQANTTSNAQKYMEGVLTHWDRIGGVHETAKPQQSNMDVDHLALLNRQLQAYQRQLTILSRQSNQHVRITMDQEYDVQEVRKRTLSRYTSSTSSG